MESNTTLPEQLRLARESVRLGGAEEEGGFILKKTNATGDEYKFVKITNANTGTPIAPVLFSANKAEFGQKIIPLFREGWINWASFHSHPGHSVRPSSTDLNKLFKGHPVNFIYSPRGGDLAKYTFGSNADEGEFWTVEEVEYE